METLNNPLMDTYFWHAVGGALVSILVWVVSRYISKIDRMLEEITKNLHELMKISSVHDNRLEDLEEDVRDLKVRRR